MGFALPINVARAVAQRLIGDVGLMPRAEASDAAGSVSTSALPFYTDGKHVTSAHQLESFLFAEDVSNEKLRLLTP